MESKKQDKFIISRLHILRGAPYVPERYVCLATRSVSSWAVREARDERRESARSGDGD